MRECAEDYANPERKWVVFDGPVNINYVQQFYINFLKKGGCKMD